MRTGHDAVNAGFTDPLTAGGGGGSITGCSCIAAAEDCLESDFSDER
jgi:hypothetical protein